MTVEGGSLDIYKMSVFVELEFVEHYQKYVFWNGNSIPSHIKKVWG